MGKSHNFATGFFSIDLKGCKRPQPASMREKPMKKLMVAFALASLSLFYLTSVATEAQQVQNKTIEGKTIEGKTIEGKTIEGKTIQGRTTPDHTVMVPAGQTYVKLDSTNRAMSTFAAG